MKRRWINPWDWGLQFSMDQGELIEGATRILHFSGQTALKPDAGAEMGVNLRFFTTDVDGFLANYDVYANWIADAGTRPPQSLIGIARLVLPELGVEIEATAAE